MPCFAAPVLADLQRGRDQPKQAAVSADRYRGELCRKVMDCLEEYDFLICRSAAMSKIVSSDPVPSRCRRIAR